MCCWVYFVWYGAAGGGENNIICFLYFSSFSCVPYYVWPTHFIDKMESEQYPFVMKDFFMQNKFHTLILPYLVL